MTEDTSHSPKKTEMIEVRVSRETKRDFLDAHRRAGRTASDVVRERIDIFVREQASPPAPLAERLPEQAVVLPINRFASKRYLAAGAAIAAASLLVVLPSAASLDLTAALRALDTNHDGALSQDEFASREKADAKRMQLRTLQQGGAPRRPKARPTSSWRPGTKAAMPRPDSKRWCIIAWAEQRPVSANNERQVAAFGAADANRDSKVDLDEYAAQQKQLLANGFSRLDADSSGGLDKAEYEALGASLLILPPDTDLTLPVDAKYGPLISMSVLDMNFATLDRNGDAKLSLQEYLPSR